VVNGSGDEALPTAPGGLPLQPVISGEFYSMWYPTAGTPTIYQMGDGSRVLRLTASAHRTAPMCTGTWSPPTTPRTQGPWKRPGLLIWGWIKGNIGGQNHTLSSDLNLAKHRAVSTWCRRFSVNIGAAALRQTQTSQNQ